MSFFIGKMLCNQIKMFSFCAKCEVLTNAWVEKEKLTWIGQLAIFFEIMGKLMAHLGNQGDEGDLETWQHGLENLAMWIWKLELGNFAMWIWKLGKVDLANMDLETCMVDLETWQCGFGNLAIGP